MRQWCNPFSYEAADDLSVCLNIIYSNNVAVVIYTKEKCTANSISKGADAFQPALWLSYFQSNFKIAFRCFGN